MTGPTSIHAIIPQLLQLIEELNLHPGEKLPGERELAVRLGWSRNTLREALTLMASRGQLEIRPRQGIFLGGKDSGDGALLLLEGAGALRLVAPSIAAAVCRRCGPAELAVLEGHTATLGRALVEEDFLLVWRSLTLFYLEIAKLASNRIVEKLIEDISSTLPEQTNCTDLPRICRDTLQNFFTAHVGLLQGLRSHNVIQTAQLAGDSLEELCRFLNVPSDGRQGDTAPSGRALK